MPGLELSSEFLQYLVSFTPESAANCGGDSITQLPALSELSKELGVSVAGLREQLEVAEAIGLVEVKPRIGIRRLPYSFLPAVRQSLTYAVAMNQAYFAAFADLRNHIEAAYWDKAARKLTVEDYQQLQSLLVEAWDKLRGHPIQIPHVEHRRLHLLIYSRLENPFVLGLLEAYWEIYEAVGLNLYADYNYLEQVWTYHQQMVDAICAGDLEGGYQALVEHKDLLYHRPHPFEEGKTERIPA
jgi:DNA-binding FadR family transcriptional regulator